MVQWSIPLTFGVSFTRILKACRCSLNGRISDSCRTGKSKAGILFHRQVHQYVSTQGSKVATEIPPLPRYDDMRGDCLTTTVVHCEYSLLSVVVRLNYVVIGNVQDLVDPRTT